MGRTVCLPKTYTYAYVCYIRKRIYTYAQTVCFQGRPSVLTPDTSARAFDGKIELFETVLNNLHLQIGRQAILLGVLSTTSSQSMVVQATNTANYA
jgi:hypothetical protein